MRGKALGRSKRSRWHLRLAATLCSPVFAAVAATSGPEELLFRLIEAPAPSAAWARSATRHHIPPMQDMSAAMLGTLMVQQSSSSVRYMVYLGPAQTERDFARIAYPPKEQSAGPMREVAVAGWRGPAMVCGQALLTERPARVVETCAARHPTAPLAVRAIEPVQPGAQARAGRHVVDAMRHADDLLAAASPAPREPGARLYRALRTLPMPRSKPLAERLESLAIVEEEVRPISKDDGVIGRLSLQGKGIVVRYVVFGAEGQKDAWYRRAVAAPLPGFDLVKSGEARETGRDRSLQDPLTSKIWATSRGDVLCDVIALHRSLPLGLRIVLPQPKASVERNPGRSRDYTVKTDLFEAAECMHMATELGAWASERGSR